ncbi:hypothetical protein FKM82_024982 [Ascaphus truei]
MARSVLLGSTLIGGPVFGDPVVVEWGEAEELGAKRILFIGALELFIPTPLDVDLDLHHVYKKTDHRNTELSEVGPRFEMKLYMIRLGTLENESTAEVEWRWHPYTNTAKKRKYLSIE